MSGKSSGATARRLPRMGLPPPTVPSEMRAVLSAVTDTWQIRQRAWARAESRAGMAPREVSAARANACATLACIEDLQDALDGRPLRERPHG